MTGAEAKEGVAIILNVIKWIQGTPPGRRTGRPGADFRRAIGDIQARPEAMLRSGEIAAALLKVYAQAVELGAPFDPMDRVRENILTLRPFGLPGKALVQLAVRLTLIQMARIAASTEFISIHDASSVLVRMIAAFEPVLIEVADYGDAMTYQAINALRAAVIYDLTERARPLPRILQLAFPLSLPALAMSNRLYSVGSRSDELIVENRVVHPAFMPMNIMALSA